MSSEIVNAMRRLKTHPKPMIVLDEVSGLELPNISTHFKI